MAITGTRTRRPDWFGKGLEPADAEARSDAGAKLVNNFVIGCDPEFCIIDSKGRVVNVATSFGDPGGEVGYDHNGLEVELRPKPAKGAYMVVKRMQDILNTNERLKKYLDYKWRSGAVVEMPDQNRRLTLGGHVHLDIPPAGHGGAQAEHENRIAALDRYTRYMEELDLLPKQESLIRREKGDPMNRAQRYGQWGDWRVAGNDRTGAGKARTEYRVMASWLYSPKIAYLALTGAKLAATAPTVALDTLKARNICYENLKAFFEHFRHRDTNAVRALDRVLNVDLAKIQAQPDVNFRSAWERLNF
jgi:hypothetical protein